MKRFKGFGMSLDTSRLAPMTTMTGPVISPDSTLSKQSVYTVDPIVPPPLFPSSTYATTQSKYSVPQVLAASPVPEKAVVEAPPQNIVVTLPKAEQRSYDPPVEVPSTYVAPAPTFANDGPRPTTASGPPSVEPGDPSLRPMLLTPVDPGTGQATASTGIEAPPQASAQSTSKSTIALAVGGLGLVAGIWFFTRS